MGFEQLASLKLEMSKQAAAKKQTEKTTRQAAVDPVLRTIGLLQKHYPLAFPKKPAAKIPLKIGIHQDLLSDAEKLGISAEDIRAALKIWCKGKRYAECMEAGVARVDLQGQVAGYVSKDEASYADRSRPLTQEPATE
jgi:ProP effector